MLKNDENKAMSPDKLQEELNNILKFNPDFAEAVSSLVLRCQWPFMLRFCLGWNHKISVQHFDTLYYISYSIHILDCYVSLPSVQHYVSYLNSVRVQDVFTSTHSLLHYFDRLVLSGAEGKSNGDEGFGRSLRYAVLNLATLHCRFNH